MRTRESLLAESSAKMQRLDELRVDCIDVGSDWQVARRDKPAILRVLHE